MIRDVEATVPSAGILFWLDEHYSKGVTARKGQMTVPMLQEVELMLKSQHAEKHVIMLDDLRKWHGPQVTGQKYPLPSDMQKLICAQFPGSRFVVASDTFTAWPRVQ